MPELPFLHDLDEIPNLCTRLAQTCCWFSVTPVSVQLQAAELLFGAHGQPHDYLQAALFRLLAVGFAGAAVENWVLKVLLAMFWLTFLNSSDTLVHELAGQLPKPTTKYFQPCCWEWPGFTYTVTQCNVYVHVVAVSCLPC